MQVFFLRFECNAILGFPLFGICTEKQEEPIEKKGKASTRL